MQNERTLLSFGHQPETFTTDKIQFASTPKKIACLNKVFQE